MDDSKRSFSPPVVGGSSLLVIFAVLCLTIFALLSLSTVQADGRLSDAAAQSVKDYYAADCKAEEILARLRAGDPIEEDLALTVTIADYADHSEIIYEYGIPISESQTLVVEAQVDGPDDYDILRWQAVPVGQWEPDDSLDVWDGGFEDEEFTPFF